MLNILTIDVEDYFQVHALSKNIRYQDWDNYECRVERNTYRLLDILDTAVPVPAVDLPTPYTVRPTPAVKATFFILGWIAERYPGLIREIKDQGHEIASHGYNHQMISSMSPAQFREDIRRSKSILEDLTGDIVLGYRAPTYSITHKRLWALEILAEEGYRYDSSIFPIRHDTYGIPDAPRFPFVISLNGNSGLEFTMLDFDLREPQSSELIPHNLNDALGPTPHSSNFNPKSIIRNPQSIMEFPPSTIRLFNMNCPISGGGYFRLLPYRIIKKALSRINREEEQPFIFYLHPWEIDSKQPRITCAGIKSKFRHYINLNKTEKRFKRLLADFQFASIRGIIERHAAAPPQPCTTKTVGLIQTAPGGE